MSHAGMNYFSEITEDDEVVESSVKPEEELSAADKAKVKLEKRRRLEDMLEAKRLYRELDEFA
jgi:hypothetical protein